MPASITLEELQTAIEQLRPDLPGLLGEDYPAFIENLDLILSKKNETELLDLFIDYPPAHKQLLSVLAKMQVGIKDLDARGSFGIEDDADLFMPPTSIQYWCDEGSHTIEARDIVERSAAGSALCPIHHTITKVVH